MSNLSRRSIVASAAAEYDETAWDQEISERLRLTRRVLGISEREAADAAGVTIRTYRKWERGGHVRDGNAMDNLCYEFEVSTVWLIDGWGSFLAEDAPEFEDFGEFEAWSWRQRMARGRQRFADGSPLASCWIGALTDAGCVYFKNRRH